MKLHGSDYGLSDTRGTVTSGAKIGVIPGTDLELNVDVDLDHSLGGKQLQLYRSCSCCLLPRVQVQVQVLAGDFSYLSGVCDCPAVLRKCDISY